MYFEELEVGTEYVTPEIEITLEQILEFAEKYDPLPMHLDEEYCKNTRFGSIISSGPMVHMLIWSSFIRTYNPFGAQLIAGKGNRMAWLAPTYPGDRLNGVIKIADKIKRNAYNGVIVLDMSIFKKDGVQVLDGRAQVVVARSGATV